MDFITLLDKAKSLGLSGDAAQEFVTKLLHESAERELRVASRETEKYKLELEEREKEREHELAVLAAKSNPNYNRAAVVANPPISLPKIPPFDEKVDEIDMYIDRFEKLASFHKWEKDKHATMLGTLLRGKALKVYCGLSPSLAENFSELKKALLNAFHINHNVYRKRFRESVIQQDEGFVQFSCRLGQNFDKWVSLSAVGETYESLRAVVLNLFWQ